MLLMDSLNENNNVEHLKLKRYISMPVLHLHNSERAVVV